MSAQNKKGTGVKAQVLKVLLSGYCNTTQDVADELGISNRRASAYVSELAKAGYIRRTGLHMPNVFGRGRELRVFEVVA